jgi:hypothetical protein
VMSRHYVGRSTKLVICYECKQDHHSSCSDTIVGFELDMLCHCASCGGKCKSAHTEKVRQNRRVKAKTGTTLEEMGF